MVIEYMSCLMYIYVETSCTAGLNLTTGEMVEENSSVFDKCEDCMYI